MTLRYFPDYGVSHFEGDGLLLLFWVPNYHINKLKVEKRK